ncbi:hypothetical protein NAT47_07415 [Flavobacterium sp. HXWNR69]|uniref:Uncharacterized protein n=1 Tax=Flavobacterium fragile TaxID=2949085 RepID=A0ABT0TGZ1_9FLAO|nr:hypothetical protein [Flavobacterium sp. HXWNR69]MCL9770242.1 hypothetical protein [Flavobacterium sp. HXWNR69]
MNKTIAIFLVTIFLCANTSVGQLLKIPNLIQHYIEHQDEVKSDPISFIDFISLHYSKNGDDNTNEHHHLPFKTFEISSHVFLLVHSTIFQLELLKSINSNKNKFFYNISLKSHLISTIWLPPKLT